MTGNVEEILAELTLDEKAAFLRGYRPVVKHRDAITVPVVVAAARDDTIVAAARIA